jgi:hypothetical protein
MRTTSGCLSADFEPFITRQQPENEVYFLGFERNSHGTASFLFLAVAKSYQVCYSDQGRLDEFSRRKSGVAWPPGEYRC